MRTRSNGPSRVLALAALGLALVALAAPLRPAVAADLGTVPDVSGRTRAEAVAAVTAQGFLAAVFEVAGTPPDTVAAQSPAAGATLPRGATVILDVRRADRDTTPAPNAVGLTPAAATSALGSLYVLKFEAVAGDAADRGKVVAQAPAMGQPLELRGTLSLRFVRDDTIPARVPTPEVMGLPTAEAVQALVDAGLLARVARASVPGAPADTVVSQWPFAGTEADRYATVDVIASETAPAEGGAPPAPTTIPVPNTVGMSESSARAALSDAGLAAEVEWIDGPSASAFLVDSQDPGAGTDVPSDAVVHLRIVRYVPPTAPGGGPGGSPTSVSVPSLVGMSQWQAEDLLASVGLWADPILVTTASVPALRVFAQQVAPGTWVAPGSTIAFRVARPLPPPSPVPVPDFYGRTKAAALALAALAGLNLDAIDVMNPARPAHRVFSQDVAAYSIVPLGTTVTVRIALPTPGTFYATVPDLVGRTEAQANAALAAAGLAGLPTVVIAPGHPLLRVFHQNPPAGTTVPVGTAVAFRIAGFVIVGHHVPDLAGRTRADAIATVTAAGYVPVPHDVFAPGRPLGRVFSQFPAAGTLRPTGTSVTFEVATAPAHTVPNVFGRTRDEAVAALGAAGFTASVAIVSAPGRPPGRVWDQAPNAGALAGAGSTVLVRVQPGIPLFAVPDVGGRTAVQANAALTAAGFVPNIVTVLAPLRPPGRVFDQNPNAGVLAPLGSSVLVRVAAGLGPIGVTVPNLFGLTRTQAQATLSAAGLVGDPNDVVILGHPFGRVFDQSPTAGSTVSGGSTVHYRIANIGIMPILATVPNVIGRTADQARADIEAAGLVSDGRIELNLGRPLHRVYSQNLTPGTHVARGTVVKWKANP